MCLDGILDLHKPPIRKNEKCVGFRFTSWKSTCYWL